MSIIYLFICIHESSASLFVAVFIWATIAMREEDRYHLVYDDDDDDDDDDDGRGDGGGGGGPCLVASSTYLSINSILVYIYLG